ncbi:MAG: hypothetical protein Q9M21_05235 [Mariprofundaceae bacterium]|nr:hypothetical protein [Mariprofundaceae bacterium]
MLNKQQVQQEEEALRLIIRDLPDDKRKQFYATAKKKLKDPDTFAVLNYIFVTGLHHFYLGHWLRGILNLVVFIVGITLIVMGLWQLGLGIIAATSLLEVYALFRSQLIVQDYNNQVMRVTLERL